VLSIQTISTTNKANKPYKKTHLSSWLGSGIVQWGGYYTASHLLPYSCHARGVFLPQGSCRK